MKIVHISLQDGKVSYFRLATNIVVRALASVRIAVKWKWQVYIK